MSSLPLFKQEAHNKWEKIVVHTAKCDRCGKHNTKVLQRCKLCNKQFCKDCIIYCTESVKNQAAHTVDFDTLDWTENTTTTRRPRQKRTPRNQPLQSRNGPISLGSNPTKIAKSASGRNRREEQNSARYQEDEIENDDNDEGGSPFARSSSSYRIRKRPSRGQQPPPAPSPRNGVLPPHDYSYNPRSEPQMTDYYPVPSPSSFELPTTYETPRAYGNPATYETPTTYRNPTAYETPTTCGSPTTYGISTTYETPSSYETPGPSRRAPRSRTNDSRTRPYPVASNTARMQPEIRSSSVRRGREARRVSFVDDDLPRQMREPNRQATSIETPSPESEEPSHQTRIEHSPSRSEARRRQDRIDKLMLEYQEVPELVAILESGDLEEAERCIEGAEALIKESDTSN